MIARIRKGNDFKHAWPITWNGQPEDFSDATDITLTAKVYGQVKALTEGEDYHIDGGTVMVDFTPTICDIAGTYNLELNYIKPSAEFVDGDRRSAVDVQAFQIVNTSAEANATEGVSLPSEAMAAYALKYDDLTEAQKDELRGKGITSIDLKGEVGDTKIYTITYADGLTFYFSVTDGHTPIFTFVGTVLHIDGVPQVDLKGETGNGIASVELTSTVGLVKTYTITFTDDTTTTFTVTDGAAAVMQEKGSNTSVVMSQKAVTDELDQLAGELNQNSNLGTTSKNVVGAINELHSGLATKASHGYVSDPKTLRDVEDQLSTRIDRHQESLNDLLGIPDVFGYRFQVGQADDRVEAVNDVAYDYSTGYAPAGSKRAKLLDKMRPYQCDLDGSNREYLQDDVRKTAGWKDSQLANPEKLQLVRIPHFFYRSFVLDGWNYVLFSELPPEKMEVFSDATQWKEILPCGYARYRGIRQPIEGVQKLLSFSGANPTTSVSLINFQTSAKNVNTKATVTPYYIYEAVAMLMVLDLGRRNAQLFYAGITNAGTSYANAAATGVTDTLSTPSGEVDVEWETGSFTKQFRWRFIECFYGQIWNFLTGIYYVYDSANDVNKVFITRDPDKINTNSNYVDYVEVGNAPSVNGWIKEFIPGTIVAGELGGSSTTYASDYNYTSKSGTTRCALAGGSSSYGGAAGPFNLYSTHAPSDASASIGASLVLLD